MRCAVLGDPVGHSLSPVLHRAAYDQLGLDWTYDAVRVPAGALAEYVEGLGGEWRGMSLTMPLKREVLPLLSTGDAWTRLAGAANTLVLDEDGARRGLNTDVPGALAAIGAATSGPLSRAVVLGGGATAASVVLALAELGVREVTFVVRDPARAEETVAAVARHPQAPRVQVRALGDLGQESADIVVSTVPAQSQSASLLTALAEVPVVFDVVYDPWPTPLAAAALVDGRTVISGLDLLVQQAVGQVRAMTGREDDVLDTMRRAGESALADRRR
ncbi:MAG: shikimate dehydrogenase [Nocardioides sp.]